MRDGVANGVIVDPGAPAIVAAHALRVSGNDHRTNPLALAGQTLTGKVAIFVPGNDAQIRDVRFSIDDVTTAEDGSAPFDLLGTLGNGNARLFSTRLLKDGSHTIKARIVLANGQIENQMATFVTSNPRPATRILTFSTNANRTSATALQGATLSTSVAVFMPSEADMVAVTFFLDDPSQKGLPKQIDLAAPFDYGGSKANGSANLIKFGKGQHKITALMVFADGYIDVVTATFTAN